MDLKELIEDENRKKDRNSALELQSLEAPRAEGKIRGEKIKDGRMDEFRFSSGGIRRAEVAEKAPHPFNC